MDGATPEPVENLTQDTFIDTVTGCFQAVAFDVGDASPGNSLGGLGLAIRARVSISDGGTVTVGPIERMSVETQEE